MVRRTGRAGFFHFHGRDGFGETCAAGLCEDGRVQIYEEGKDVKGKDGGNDPLKDGGNIGVFGECGACEDDGEDQLDEDKGEFDPKGDAQDAMVSVFCGKKAVSLCRRRRRRGRGAKDARQRGNREGKTGRMPTY